MLAGYKKKTNIGIGLAIAVWIISGGLLYILGNDSMENLRAVQGLGAILFVYGCYCYAKGKGHHGAWGILGLFWIFGLIGLCFLPDKHKVSKKTENSEQNQKDEKVGGVLSITSENQGKKRSFLIILAVIVLTFIFGFAILYLSKAH